MAYLALEPVSAAVYAKLNVSGLTSLLGAGGALSDQPPQARKFPYVMFSVGEEESRGFGTGGLPQVNLRVHVFSESTPKQAQAIMQKVIELLRDASLTVTGYAQAGKVFYDETITVDQEIVGGRPVHELVANFRIFVEETA